MVDMEKTATDKLSTQLTSGQRRSVKRRHLVFYLRVFNQKDHSILGHVIDISQDGLKLVSDAPIKEGERFSLRMRLPMEVTDKDELQFDAVSRWCVEDDNPDFHLTGLMIENISPEVSEYIRELIGDYGYEDDVPKQ